VSDREFHILMITPIRHCRWHKKTTETNREVLTNHYDDGLLSATSTMRTLTMKYTVSSKPFQCMLRARDSGRGLMPRCQPR